MDKLRTTGVSRHFMSGISYIIIDVDGHAEASD
jgi:hypothetical protein